jgi:hypothetical protein
MTDPLAALPIAELGAQLREQWLTSLKQGQEIFLGATKAFADVAKSVPLPALPGFVPTPAVGEAFTVAFDLATETLAAQRDFAIQVAELLKP